MRIGLLAEEIYRRGVPVYLGSATPETWTALKKQFQSLNIEFIALELQPGDAATEWVIVASATFGTDTHSAGAKLSGVRRAARKLESYEGCQQVLSMIVTADEKGYRVETSGVWGILVIRNEELKKNGNHCQHGGATIGKRGQI